ncbi:MAG: transcription termination/antitermination protein NusA, partial [Alphaproteobacteria bacterium]
ILPRTEQIPGETNHPTERIRAIIIEVKEMTSQVKVIISRSHPDLIRRLFEQEVPEVAERIIEIKALSRKAGYRSKVAVSSIDAKVDAVGACVGVRGNRIKNIVDELGGEKIDIVRWNESSQILIGNSLRPAEVRETALCFELNRATVVVSEDQLSLAIGKRGLNVFLAARLTGWDIEILTPQEYSSGVETLIKVLREVEAVDDTLIDKVVALGMVSVQDLDEVGAEPLVEALEVTEDLAAAIVARATEAGIEIAAEKERAATAAATVLASHASPDSATAAAPTDGDDSADDAAETDSSAASESPTPTDGDDNADDAAETDSTAASESPTPTDGDDNADDAAETDSTVTSESPKAPDEDEDIVASNT